MTNTVNTVNTVYAVNKPSPNKQYTFGYRCTKGHVSTVGNRLICPQCGNTLDEAVLLQTTDWENVRGHSGWYLKDESTYEFHRYLEK